MAVKKEIPRADGSGITTFYRLSSQHATVETDDSEGQETTFDYNDAQNKPSINDVALVGNKTSADLGLQPAGDYITNAQADAKFVDNDELAALNYVNQAQLTAAIANIQHFHREIVDGLPLTGQDNVLYMVRKTGTSGDVYNEYIWVGLEYSTNGYELIGTTAADLTDFYTKTETNSLLDTKVTKRTGFDLSSNDYTTAEKTKLAGLENYDDSQLQAAVAALHNYDDTGVKADIAANASDIADNALAIQNIEADLAEKLNMVRLIQNGDSWLWEDLEDNNLSLAQALALLVQDNYILCIENTESDGKAMPAHYEITGTAQNPTGINIVYKDREDNARLLVIANNTYTNTLLGKITHYTQTVSALPASGNVGDICIMGNDKLLYIYDGTEWVGFDKTSTIDLSDYLAKDNSTPYTPTDRYHPATKLYVDNSIANIFIPTATSQLSNDSGFITKSVSDLTNYYNKNNTYTKTEVNALIQGGYQLPIADSNTLGGVKGGGDYITIAQDGVIDFNSTEIDNIYNEIDKKVEQKDIDPINSSLLTKAQYISHVEDETSLPEIVNWNNWDDTTPTLNLLIQDNFEEVVLNKNNSFSRGGNLKRIIDSVNLHWDIGEGFDYWLGNVYISRNGSEYWGFYAFNDYVRNSKQATVAYLGKVTLANNTEVIVPFYYVSATSTRHIKIRLFDNFYNNADYYNAWIIIHADGTTENINMSQDSEGSYDKEISDKCVIFPDLNNCGSLAIPYANFMAFDKGTSSTSGYMSAGYCCIGSPNSSLGFGAWNSSAFSTYRTVIENYYSGIEGYNTIDFTEFDYSAEEPYSITTSVIVNIDNTGRMIYGFTNKDIAPSQIYTVGANNDLYYIDSTYKYQHWAQNSGIEGTNITGISVVSSYPATEDPNILYIKV